ncbi:MAG: hypothetical protein AAFW88_07950 [Pseudomonadota bacterium]
MFSKQNLLIVGGAAGVFAIAYVVDEADKAMNYEETRARVTSVTVECTLEKVEGKITTYTDPMDCHMAEFAQREHPRYKNQGFKIKRSGVTEFDYYGLDGKVLSNSLKTYTDPNGCELSVGDEFRILQHKTDETRVREAEEDSFAKRCS